jgi:hypothetical protein
VGFRECGGLTSVAGSTRLLIYEAIVNCDLRVSGRRHRHFGRSGGGEH